MSETQSHTETTNETINKNADDVMHLHCLGCYPTPRHPEYTRCGMSTEGMKIYPKGSRVSSCVMCVTERETHRCS